MRSKFIWLQSDRMKVKRISNPWPSNFIPRIYTDVCRSPQQGIGDFHSSLIHNRKKEKLTTQIPINERMTKQTMVNSYQWNTTQQWKRTVKSPNNTQMKPTKVNWVKEARHKILISFIWILSKSSKIIPQWKESKRGSLVGGMVRVRKVARDNLLEWWKVLFFDQGGNHTSKCIHV